MSAAGNGKAVMRVVVEEDPRWLSPYGATRDSNRRALFSAVVTLTLGVLGSTILPVPYAFSKIGIAMGVLTILIVATVNVITCCMLIRAAALTGCYSFEELAECVGGGRAKTITRASLILLLYGTLCGGLAFLADVARIMVLKGLPHAPQLLQDDGRPVMLLVVLLVLLPLCLQRHIRQARHRSLYCLLEKAATLGVLVVVALSAIIIWKAVSLDFPAVRDGELPLLSFKVDGHLPEAFSVLGFAFYMQPMLMPVLKEMPRGPGGVRVAETAVYVVLYGSASCAYGSVGVFGASIYGSATESNIMVNDILTDSRATLALYAALILYLCCGMVTTQYALRASVDAWVMGPNAPYHPARHALQTVCIIVASIAVAVTFPTQAEKIFAVTGATAVCLACYIIPVYIHLKLHAHMGTGPWQRQHGSDTLDLEVDGVATDGLADGTSGSGPGLVCLENNADVAEPAKRQPGASEDLLQVPLLSPGLRQHHAVRLGSCGRAASPGCRSWGRTASHLVLPGFVLAVGIGCSLAGLWVAVLDCYETYFVDH